MSISIIIGIFGDPEWDQRAIKAEQSAIFQSLSAREVITYRGDTLAEARNLGAAESTGDWLIFLDADDELDYNYVEEMNKAEWGGQWRPSDPWKLYQPATLGLYEDGSTDDESVVIPPHVAGIGTGNHLVIGTMVHRSVFQKAGGFRELPCLEDWDLWIRCVIEGAIYAVVPTAIYKVGQRENGRNTNDLETYHAIRDRYRDILR